jgi:3-hydroxybutyryl-CoA dehydrogenase
VIEAVFEDLDVKTALLAELDRRASRDTIFATNTSSISIARLPSPSGGSSDPVPGDALLQPRAGDAAHRAHSSARHIEATEAAVRDLAAELDKQVIVSADRPGFIVNRMLMPLLTEAIRAYEEGLGSAEDIDTGAKVGLNHPMGPLELADFIGLDVCLNVCRVLYEGIGGEQFRPPAMLERLVGEGKLGQKTGEGFYRYPR